MRLEAVIVDGSIAESTDWPRYAKRVVELLSSLLSVATASGEPVMPFRIGVARGRQLVHLTEVPATDTRGTRWTAELQHAKDLLSRPASSEPGALALQALPSRAARAWPMNGVVFVTPAGSRSLDPHLLGQVLSSTSGLDLELLVVPDGAASQPVSLGTSLILLQASFPLKVGLLDEETWDWSLRRLVERQRVHLGLELGAEVSISCTLCPASLPLQPAYELEVCNCHSAILSPPAHLSLSMHTEPACPKRCPCSKLALDQQDLSKVTAVGPLVWPGSLARFAQGGPELPPRHSAWASSGYDALDAPHDRQAWPATLEALNRILLERLPLISLRGDPWILSADVSSMNAQPGLLASLARQLHQSKQGLVCALRRRDALRDDGRCGWMARSLAGVSRVVLLPQGPPFTMLLLKALSTTPQLTHASSSEAELGANASACDPDEKRLVATALSGLDASDELCAPEWWQAEEGAAVVARRLSTTDTHPTMGESAPAWRGAGAPSMHRAQPAPRVPWTPPCCGLMASEGCYDGMQPWTTQGNPAMEEGWRGNPPTVDPATRVGLGRTGGGNPAPGAAAGHGGISRFRPAVKRKMQRIALTEAAAPPSASGGGY
jgi:hypothetical protein